MDRYKIIEGNEYKKINDELDKEAKEGWRPILYSTTVAHDGKLYRSIILHLHDSVSNK